MVTDLKDIRVYDWNQYSSLASRTLGALKKESIQEKLTCAALGLCGETNELLIEIVDGDREKIINELGDIFWYLNLYFYGLNIKLPIEIKPEKYDSYLSVEKVVSDIICSAGMIANEIKKVKYQDHPLLVTKLKDLGKQIISWINVCLYHVELTFEEVATANIQKIQKRYPEGFNPNKSINKEV